MKKILKFIGSILWLASVFTVVFALLIHYRGTFVGNTGLFAIAMWTFLLIFVCYTPYYLYTLFSHTLYLTEEEIKRKIAFLDKQIDVYDLSARRHAQATKQCFTDLQELKERCKLKSQEEKLADVDAFFDNKPLDPVLQNLRQNLLDYIQKYG